MRSAAKSWLAGVILVALLVAGYAWYRLAHPGRPKAFAPSSSAAPLDLLHPDALVATQSLSRLPRDLLKAPLLKDLLTEDFVFYYEQREGRLDLAGTLRRIAYEHELTLGDEILAYVFNAPAHVALWKGQDGTLGHYLLLIDRRGLVKALELASKVVLNDSQLSVRGQIALADGTKLPVYELKYGYRHSLFFTDHLGVLMVFSDAELLLPVDPAKQAAVGELLARRRPDEIFRERFRIGSASHAHTLVASAEYLSFGYQRFFPAVEALRLDFGASGWSASALLTGALPDASELWKVAPTAPAFCAAVPVDPGTLAETLRQIDPGEEAGRLLKALVPPAAACWYRRSRLYTPLVIIQTGGQAVPTAPARVLFEKTVGALEAAAAARAKPEAEAPGSAEAGEKGEPVPPSEGKAEAAEKGTGSSPVASMGPSPEPEKSEVARLPVSETPCPEGAIWRREVSSRYGLYEAATSPDAASMRSSKFFAVTLAYCQRTFFFSPDDTLVKNAVAVGAKQYPPLADSLPRDLKPAAVVFPESLVELVETELSESLPDAQEPVFRQSVSRYLKPQLDRLKSFPACALLVPSPVEAGWVPIQWKELFAR